MRIVSLFNINHSPSSDLVTNLVAGWDEYLCKDRLSWPGLFVSSPGRKITEKPLPASGGDGHESDLICPRSSGEPERCIVRGSTRSTVWFKNKRHNEQRTWQAIPVYKVTMKILTVIARYNHRTDCRTVSNNSRWGRRQWITIAIIGWASIFHFNCTRVTLHITGFV